MFGFLKRLFCFRSSAHYALDPEKIAREQWQADFSRPDDPGKIPHVRFSITSENLYRAYLANNALCLGLKKNGCIAWTENMIFRYEDMVMKGRVKIDPKGGYAAAGFMFRMIDERSYYMALVSSRGYFRLDAVRNGVPLALAGWTEAPFMGSRADIPSEFELEIVCYGSRLLLMINGAWAGAWDDTSIPGGRIAFAAASYESGGFGVNAENSPAIKLLEPGQFTALAELTEFSVDSRVDFAGKRFDETEHTASPDSRVRLAETFAAQGRAGAALAQLRMAWESREKMSEALAAADDGVILAAIQSGEPVRTVNELLLGARLALALELWAEAEEYINVVLDTKGAEKEGRSMKAALLYSCSRYDELIRFAEEEAGAEKPENLFADPAAFCNLIGHAYFNKGEYKKAADAYDRSFAYDEKNGMTAKNAAAAYELLREKDEPDRGQKTLSRYLKAGRAFLADNHYEELGLLIPKFRIFGKDNWEARALAGKWAFGIEDWKTARAELEAAEQLRKEKKSSARDPAVYFLQALLLTREGKRREALSLFEKAVKYAPFYPLFRFRLVENRFLLNNDPADAELALDLEKILSVEKDDESYGWIHNFAAHVALSKGDTGAARNHLEKASAVLGEVPAVRVNRAVFLHLEGHEEEALCLLESRPEEDPEGLMANCAGNLLVRSRRFEEADAWYKKALAAAPFNAQYRYNRGSCLIELGHYGEADDVLTAGARGNAFSPETSADMLELIAFVAVKKGEHKRAEAAIRAALKLNPNHVASLLQFGWNRAFARKWDEVADTLDRLDKLELNAGTTKSRGELEKWMRDALYKTISCAACGREWLVEREPKTAASLRLYAAPPDDMPAGTCPACGKSYCVGCRKDALDESGRFTCSGCGKTLKLSNDGLKALLNDWAKKNMKKQRNRKKAEAALPEPEGATVKGSPGQSLPES